jgi:hypothetical protein
MSLLNKLKNLGSVFTKLNGTTPSSPDLANSKLHNTYSINGIPSVKGKPSPSNLSLGGRITSKYTDNLPK